jgi:ribonuclease T2
MSVDGFFTHVTRELGPDLAQRIQLLCAEGRYLQEIRLNLPRDILPSSDVAKMAAGAPQARSRTENCASDSIYIERSGRE